MNWILLDVGGDDFFQYNETDTETTSEVETVGIAELTSEHPEIGLTLIGIVIFISILLLILVGSIEKHFRKKTIESLVEDKK